MKKLFKLEVFLLLILCFAIIITGCAQKPDQSNGSVEEETSMDKDEGSSEVKLLTEPGTFPIVNEPVEITVLVGGSPNIEDFQTNAFTKWYEELTHVKVKFETAPSDSIPETLNLRLAGGDYPDVFMNMGVSKTQEMIYGPQGVFLPLNDLIDEYGYYFKKLLEKKPEIYKSITAPDGNIYSLPNVNECFHCTMSTKFWIYEPWLETLGLSMPTTTEELYQVLKAFKEKDPNRNGEADEIPMAGAPKSWNTSIELSVMNSFVYTPDQDKRMFLEDGKVTVSYNKPEWKEGLKFLNRLYSEGLIAGESFTQNAEQLKSMGEYSTPILGSFPGGWHGVAVTHGGESGRWKEYVSVAPLKGPKGVKQTPLNPYDAASGKLVITNAAKHPEVIVRWADGFYGHGFGGEEIFMRANIGIPGEEWAEAKEGMLGADGKSPAKYELLKPWGNLTNNTWYQASPLYISDEYRISLYSVEYKEEPDKLLVETKNHYQPFAAPKEMWLPPLYFTEDQTNEIADIEISIRDYVDQTIARAVTGDMDIEKEWDSYLQNLKDMNLDRYLQVYQDALTPNK